MDPSMTKTYEQNIVVLRHGDRIDHFDPTWKKTASTPWDPPLMQCGLARAFQTASEVMAALCAVDDDPNAMSSNDVVSIDPSKLKVSIEYGLCETLYSAAIRPDVAPEDGIFHFDVPKLEALLSSGILDRTVEPVYKEMPQWEETVTGFRSRYEEIVKALADKYPPENLLLVTHGVGVSVSVSAYMEGNTVDKVYYDYCAYTQLRRSVSWENESFTAGKFEVLTKIGQTGVTYNAN